MLWVKAIQTQNVPKLKLLLRLGIKNDVIIQVYAGGVGTYTHCIMRDKMIGMSSSFLNPTWNQFLKDNEQELKQYNIFLY